MDTGGTFSDFVFFNEESGEITITKVSSTPREPFQAVLNGVQELLDQGVPAKDISFFSHGTTVGTNTLLEEKGARTGLLVTQGFRGIYEVMEQTRGYGPATYDLFFEKPRLLATPLSHRGDTGTGRFSGEGFKTHRCGIRPPGGPPKGESTSAPSAFPCSTFIR